MNRERIQHSIDNCLNHLEFTPEHRRTILDKARQKKRMPRFYQGLAGLALVSVLLIAMVLNKPPYQDQSALITSQGHDSPAPGYTAMAVSPIEDMTQQMDEAQALEMARDALALRIHKDRPFVDAFNTVKNQKENEWDFTFFSQDRVEWLYQVTVDKATLSIHIERNDAILAQEEDEAAALKRQAEEALLAYENDLLQKKGAAIFWSLKEKALRSDLAREAGLLSATWDALPQAGDLPQDVAIASAREQLRRSNKAADMDVDTLIPFVSFLRDNKGAAIWYIQFSPSPKAERTIGVEVNARPVVVKTPSVVNDSEADTEPLSYTAYYYNPQGGEKYHSDLNCPGVSSKFLPLTVINSDTLLKNLTPCSICIEQVR